jgi:hypothetical protein
MNEGGTAECELVGLGHQKGLTGRHTYKVKCKGGGGRQKIYSCPEDRRSRFQRNPTTSNHFCMLFGHPLYLK